MLKVYYLARMIDYIAYYRVSTQQQGRSGLGLEAQQQAVRSFLKDGQPLQAEFTEVESGKRDTRPQLTAAITQAQRIGATLLIAKLDRLSRNASFIFALRDSGVKFVAADMPDANHLTVGILAVIADHERQAISDRTKAALSALKARGVQLGSPQNLTPAARGGKRRPPFGATPTIIPRTNVPVPTLFRCTNRAKRFLALLPS